jgi:curved DNA-binding protein CbpA
LNYYDILGVSAKADQQEIKRAFRKMALQYHPDRNTDADSSEQFRLVYIAYDVLQDPLKRSIYDMIQQVKEKCREEEMQNEAYASASERDYARRRRAYEEREQRRKEYFETHYRPDEDFRQEQDLEEEEDEFSSKLEFHSKQGLGLFFCFMLLCVGFTSLLFGSLFVIWEHFNGAILLGCTFWAVGVSLSFVAGKGLLAVFQTWKT